MGGWKRTEETVYAVAWDDERLLKIGQSCRQRWRRFVLRGARIVDLFPITSKRDWNLEQEYHRAALSLADLAFGASDGTDAIPFLGDRGGYLECYRIPEGMSADSMLEQCSRIVREHRASALLGSMPRTENTNGLTQMELSRDESLT